MIAVCIDDHPKTPVILRAAQRLARESGEAWVALHVETTGRERRDDEAGDRMQRFIMLAEQMGAGIERIQARDIFQGLSAFLVTSLRSEAPIRQLVVGENGSERRFGRWTSSLGERLSRRFQDRIAVRAIPLAGGALPRLWGGDRFRHTRRADVLLALLAVALAGLASEALPLLLHAPATDMAFYDIPAIFLVACMFASARIGLFAGLVATGLSTLCIIYVTFIAGHAGPADRLHDFVNTLLFLAAGLLISLFGSHVRAHAEGAFRREKRTQALFRINRLTAGAQSREEVLGILHDTLTGLLEMEVVFFLPPALNPDAIVPAYPVATELPEDAEEALQRCWKETTVTSSGGSHWRFEPLVTPSGEIGVMGVHLARKLILDASFHRLLGSIADHSAAIIERVERARMSEASRIREEREKLRSMLLSSVSHDLKTPLASVIGSLSVFHSMGDNLSEDRRRLLTQTAFDEAQRLDSFISNILDMARLESGEIKPRVEWAEPVDALLRVKKRLRQRLRNHAVEIAPVMRDVEVEMDVMLTEQVLGNLLDNAAKYSAPGSRIDVRMQIRDGGFVYEISDAGPGIPPDKHEAIFDKYSRLKREDSQVAGTGLGLAISRAIMELQHGAITVSPHDGGGAVFGVFFPFIRNLDARPAGMEE